MTVLQFLSAAETSELGHPAEGGTCGDVFLAILWFASVQFGFLESDHSEAWPRREPRVAGAVSDILVDISAHGLPLETQYLQACLDALPAQSVLTGSGF